MIAARTRMDLIVLLLVALGIAAVSVHAAAARHRNCTHGLSSIGPVTVVDGRVVDGSAVAHTEACLP